jgi:uncharacterized SAM-binding protein YcdF (DUF218 family)
LFFVLSKILDLFVSPYTWGVLLLAASIPWRRPREGSRWKRRRAFGVAGLATLLFFSVEPVSNRIGYSLEHTAPSTYRSDVVYDAVILLGGVGDERVFSETGEPAFDGSVERLTGTYRLLREGRARFAIVTGGAETPALAQWSEARALGGQLVDWGIDPSRVIREDQARNTRENAVYSARIVRERGWDKVLIVTSAYHVRRARECFAAVGLNADTLAVDFRAHSSLLSGTDSWLPRAMFLGDSVKMLREMLGLYIYRWQGYAKPVSS